MRVLNVLLYSGNAADRINVQALVNAVVGVIPPKQDQTNLSCHAGLTSAERCARCSRDRAVWDAIDKLCP